MIVSHEILQKQYNTQKIKVPQYNTQQKDEKGELNPKSEKIGGKNCANQDFKILWKM